MKTMILKPLALVDQDGCLVRKCLIVRRNADNEESVTKLWFSYKNTVELPPYDDCDSYLLATLMDAMREGRALIIEGSVSRLLLSNLHEFQAAWVKWLPETYKPVEIIAEIIRSNGVLSEGAISAFSGGVDATFTVWRHANKSCGHGSQNIKMCAMVHGFDIPLSDEPAFRNAFSAAANTLEDLKIPLFAVKTNYREVTTVNWEHGFAIALVATLTAFKLNVGRCLIGSSEPYDNLAIPWGSSPITDYLLSSDDFSVIHDGASFSRTQKVGEISKWARGVKNLRVCWEGSKKDVNCGVCEKCMRTKLNFLANEHNIPECFQNSELDYSNLILRNKAQYIELKDICNYSLQHKVRAKWVPVVEKILSNYEIEHSGLSNKFLLKVFFSRLARKLKKIIPKKV